MDIKASSFTPVFLAMDAIVSPGWTLYVRVPELAVVPRELWEMVVWPVAAVPVAVWATTLELTVKSGPVGGGMVRSL